MDQYKEIIKLPRDNELEKARNSQALQEIKMHLSKADAYSTCLKVLSAAVIADSIKNSKI